MSRGKEALKALKDAGFEDVIVIFPEDQDGDEGSQIVGSGIDPEDVIPFLREIVEYAEEHGKTPQPMDSPEPPSHQWPHH